MPVFNRKSREKANAGDILDLEELIKDVRRQLKAFRRFDVEWIYEYLDDKGTDLDLDPTEEEFEQIQEDIEKIHDKIEEIEEDYDLDDEDEWDDIKDELEDLELDI